ncbi:MAG TPA: cobalt ECF transporter T component CbiQ [Phycisphaerae bacterium]|nr:cobalt ECF transporter T component CbiQ [Phycisphaerae bacterium]
MHHRMLDHFAAGRSAVHRLDPAAKTVALVAVVLATVLVGRDHFLPLVPTALALGVYHALGRTPPLYVARRLLVVSPFALAIVVLFPFLEPGRVVWTLGPWGIAVTHEGLVRAGHLAAKFGLSAWATVLLLATTRFQDVLQALARLRVPRAFVVQLAFLYRYLWVLLDEGMRVGMARAARDGGLGPWRLRFHSRVGVVGVLFLRTYDRAERIYWAMAARGFDGTLHGPAAAHMHATDWLFAMLVSACGAGVVVWDQVAYG